MHVIVMTWKLCLWYCSYMLFIVLGTRKSWHYHQRICFVGNLGDDRLHFSTSLKQALSSLHILKFNSLGALNISFAEQGHAEFSHGFLSLETTKQHNQTKKSGDEALPRLSRDTENSPGPVGLWDPVPMGMQPLCAPVPQPNSGSSGALHWLGSHGGCDFWPLENMRHRYQVKIIHWWLSEDSLPPAPFGSNFFITFLRVNAQKTQCKDRRSLWAATQPHLPPQARPQHFYFS